MFEETIIKKIINSWEPLEYQGKKVFLWDYKEEENTAVVYRFVLKMGIGSVPVYVGSGANLSSKKGIVKSLVHQYTYSNNRDNIKKKILEEAKSIACGGWTEVIRLSTDDEKERKILENIAILKSFLDFTRLKSKCNSVKFPSFQNSRIEGLDKLTEMKDLIILLESQEF